MDALPLPAVAAGIPVAPVPSSGPSHWAVCKQTSVPGVSSVQCAHAEPVHAAQVLVFVTHTAALSTAAQSAGRGTTSAQGAGLWAPWSVVHQSGAWCWLPSWLQWPQLPAATGCPCPPPPPSSDMFPYCDSPRLSQYLQFSLWDSHREPRGTHALLSRDPGLLVGITAGRGTSQVLPSPLRPGHLWSLQASVPASCVHMGGACRKPPPAPPPRIPRTWWRVLGLLAPPTEALSLGPRQDPRLPGPDPTVRGPWGCFGPGPGPRSRLNLPPGPCRTSSWAAPIGSVTI